MSNEFGFRSYATMRKPAKDVWAEATMKFGIYAIVTSALMLVLIECGQMLYHLSLMIW